MKKDIAHLILSFIAMGLCLWGIFATDYLFVWARWVVALMFVAVVGVTAFATIRYRVLRNNGKYK